MNKKNILLLSISWPFLMCSMNDKPEHRSEIKETEQIKHTLTTNTTDGMKEDKNLEKSSDRATEEKDDHVEWVVDFHRMRFVPVTGFVAACYHNIVNKP